MCPKMSHRRNIPEFALLIREEPGLEVFLSDLVKIITRSQFSGSIRIFKRAPALDRLGEDDKIQRFCLEGNGG